MRFRTTPRLTLGLCLGLAIGLLSAHLEGSEQGSSGTGEKVRFDTVDGVEIHGAFYPGTRGTKSPCVMLLHEYGGASQQEGWPELAGELQKKGFTVLSFDFRGHGESTEVGPKFYSDNINRTLRSAKSAKSATKLSYKDFTNTFHYAQMVNDITAAKRFLDRKNDSGECNSSDLIIIGAGTGGTLGALFIRSEYERYEFTRNPLGIITGRSSDPEGKAIAGAVWISMASNLGTSQARVDQWLKSPVKEKVPMYFLTGEQDKSAAYSKRLYDAVSRGTPDKVSKLTGMKQLPGSNKSSGRDLLGKKSLGTEEFIVKYCEKVIEDRGTTVHVKKDVDKSIPVMVPVQKFLQ